MAVLTYCAALPERRKYTLGRVQSLETDIKKEEWRRVGGIQEAVIMGNTDQMKEVEPPDDGGKMPKQNWKAVSLAYDFDVSVDLHWDGGLRHVLETQVFGE